ncbi:metallophosphoesterase family protein [Latilactobacillus sp. 5-91]|uniref:metallophosphoesterase family protein n=1 Tax=Latilactobacillus sp. 5-91 TaxID=3410924 RepID=UPI003C75BA1B
MKTPKFLSDLWDEPSPFQNREARNQKQHNWEALRRFAKSVGNFLVVAVNSVNDAVKNADDRMTDIEDSFNSQISGSTSLDEVIAGRKPKGKAAYKTIGLRMDDMITIEDGTIMTNESIDIGGKLDPVIKEQLDEFILTLPREGFKVLMVTDSHYEDLYDESSPFSYPYAYDALTHLNAVNYLSQYVDVIIAGGDNANGLNQDVNHSIADQAQYCAKILQTETDADKFILLGNHDDASTGIRLEKITPDKIIKEADFKKLFRTGELINDENREGDSLYFYKDYPDSKIRLIGLNGLDVPESKTNDDGTLKFTRYLDYSYSQKQIDWLVNEALSSVPEEFQIVVTTHIPLVYDFTPSTETTWANGNILEGLLNAVATGGRYTGKSEDGIPSELQVIVAADFTTQGPRKVAGLWAGHVHTEKITERDNFTQCLFINDCNTNPDNIGTIQALGITIATVDPSASKVTLSGIGRATSREYDY